MTAVMLVVAAMGEWVLLPSSLVQRLDEGGVARATGLLAQNPGLQDAAVVWARLSEPVVVHLVVLLVALLLVVRRRVAPGALLVVPIGLVGWALEAVCKLLVERPRPTEAVLEVGSWSYPSGHATNAALGAVLLISLVAAVHSAWIRWGTTVLVVAGAALTAADRVLLGVHHPSDVLAGLALGAAMGVVGVVGLRVATPFAKP